MHTLGDPILEAKSKVVALVLKKRDKFYKEKKNQFNFWASKKSEMNGVSRGNIQSNLKQMLKELDVPNENAVLLLADFYNNLHDFDASSLINKIYTNYEGSPLIVDIFNKDMRIKNNSVRSMLVSLVKINQTRILFSDKVLAGICVFIHFILQGGRGGIDGFGGSEDLVDIGKKRHAITLKNKETLNAKKNGLEMGKESIRRLSQYNNESNLSEDDMENCKEQVDCEVKKFDLNGMGGVPDDWEDL